MNYYLFYCLWAAAFVIVVLSIVHCEEHRIDANSKIRVESSPLGIELNEGEIK